MPLFTSESVTEGHPDKICDQISDAVLDEIIKQDKNGRVACEVCATKGLFLIMGEITTRAYVDIQKIVRNVVKDIGYVDSSLGLDYKSCGVIVSIGEQSPEIALGVNESLESKISHTHTSDVGAGDQGMVFGFACRDTDTLMPAPIHYAHQLAKSLSVNRKNLEVPFLRPDGKTQVTICYDEKDKVCYIDTIVISTQHDEEIKEEEIYEYILKKIIKPTIPENLLNNRTKYFINPTGKFTIGGPHADCGLTGRKIIVDTYGGYARHGGGAFSGKDPTKVDRSGAYFARFIAKNIVANGLADVCEIQIAYAIGVSNPVSVWANTFGTSKVKEEQIITLINEKFDMRPGAIIERLGLLKPIYQKTAAYGHFGRVDIEFPWEEIVKI